VLISALVAILSWNFAWLTMSGPFDHFGESWRNGIAAVVCLVSTVLFVFACRSGRRSYLGPVAGFGVAMVALLVIGFSIWLVGGQKYEQAVSRFHIARDASKLENTIQRLDVLESYFERGAKEFAAAKTVSDLPIEFTSEKAARSYLDLGDTTIYPVDYHKGGSEPGTLIVPHQVIFAMVDGRIMCLEHAKDLSSAKSKWLSHLPKALASLKFRRNQSSRLLGAIGEAREGRLIFFNQHFSNEVANMTITFIAFLLLLQSIAFRIGCRRTHWPRRASA
jgi:hypothetical protein